MGREGGARARAALGEGGEGGGRATRDPPGAAGRMASPTSTPPRARTHSPAIPTKGGDSVEYSDRFIPSRRGTNLQEGFALLPDSPPTARANVNGETSAETALRDDNLDTYNVLLRSELLGDEAAAPSVYRCQEHLSTGLLSPPSNNNLFRYRVSPSPRDSSLPSSTGALAAESRRLLPVSKRVTRKIPSVPYKVLDAPALQVSDHQPHLARHGGMSACAHTVGRPPRRTTFI